MIISVSSIFYKFIVRLFFSFFMWRTDGKNTGQILIVEGHRYSFAPL